MRPVELFRYCFPNARAEYIEAFRRADGHLQQHGVTTPLRFAHFLAQGAAETAGFTAVRENMSYSASRLMQVFGVGKHSAAVTATEAAQLAHKPEAIAERVYGLGNPRKAKELGNTRPGDGWRFRGGGIKQITGGYNYREFGETVGVDIYNSPELVVHPDYAVSLALAYWSAKGCNKLADRNDILSISRAVNLGNANSSGTPNGLADRRSYFNRIWAKVRDNPLVFEGTVQPIPSPPVRPTAPGATPVAETPKSPASAAPKPGGTSVWAALWAGLASLFSRKGNPNA